MKSSSDKKLAFLLDDGWVLEKREAARDLARTLPLEILTHDQLTYDELKGEFTVTLLPRYKLRGLKYFLIMFFANDLNTSLARTERRRRMQQKSGLSKWAYHFRDCLGRIGLRPYNCHQAFKILYRDSQYYGDQLARYHTVMYNTVSIEDKRILYEAHNVGIPLLSWVYSWDNPIKDNEFIPNANHYLAWNHFTKHDLMEVHDVPKDRISITGPVQFEYLITPSEKVADDQQPFVLFACATAPDVYVEQEIDLILMVRELLDRIAPAVALHVRPYPFRNAKDPYKYKRLHDKPGIKVLYYGEVQGGTVVPDVNDREEKLQQFKQSICYINVGSTIGLEASFADAPILQIAFSLPSVFRPKLDLAHQFKNEHLRYLIDQRFPNTCMNVSAFEAALTEILVAGDVEKYRPYTDHLQEFANPIPESSFIECFCNKVHEFTGLERGRDVS